MKIIRGKQPGAKKVVIYGPEGIGKSTFASRFPDPVFIDTEGSTKDMDVARTEAPSSWAMLLEQVKYVKEHPEVCRTLAVDTIDWAERMCVDHICAAHQKKGVEDFGYGKGYVYVKEEFGRFLDMLAEAAEAGVNVVLTAHAQIKKFEQPDEMGSYDRWELKLGQKTASQTSPLVKEWADMLLFANYKTHSVAVDDKGQKRKAQGGKRVMYASHHPCWDAKNRYGLPDEMDFDYAGIAHVIEPKGARSRSGPEPEQSEERPAPNEPEQSKGTSEEAAAPSPENPKWENPEQGADPGGQTLEQSQPEPEQADAAPQAEEEGPQKPIPENDKGSAFYIDEKIPKPLRDLMIANTVFEEEIQAICEARMYVPMGTPMSRYATVNPGLNERIVSYWDQIFNEVKEMRSKQEVPFN